VKRLEPSGYFLHAIVSPVARGQVLGPGSTVLESQGHECARHRTAGFAEVGHPAAESLTDLKGGIAFKAEVLGESDENRLRTTESFRESGHRFGDTGIFGHGGLLGVPISPYD
jgi:hypothetical protein